jgi:hypothetical protein
MNGSVIREPSRSLKEQFSRSSEAWKEQSTRSFGSGQRETGGGFPFFSLSASRYFGEKETLCLYWPLATVVIAGPKVLDFYAVFCAHRATCLKADGNDIKVLNLILSGNSDGASETDPSKDLNQKNRRT